MRSQVTARPILGSLAFALLAGGALVAQEHFALPPVLLAAYLASPWYTDLLQRHAWASRAWLPQKGMAYSILIACIASVWFGYLLAVAAVIAVLCLRLQNVRRLEQTGASHTAAPPVSTGLIANGPDPDAWRSHTALAHNIGDRVGSPALGWRYDLPTTQGMPEVLTNSDRTRQVPPPLPSSPSTLGAECGVLEGFRLHPDSPIPQDKETFEVPHEITPPRSGPTWVQPGCPVTIAGVTLPDGMVYVGATPSGRFGPHTFYPLIDPALPVDHLPHPADLGQYRYFGYSHWIPVIRSAYLHWLAGGRRQPDADVGLTKMFYAGLERRLLCDEDVTPVEAQQLLAELRVLARTYRGHSWSSKQLVENMDFAEALHAPDRLYRRAPASLEQSVRRQTLLRVALGQMAVDRVPLTAEWAFLWASIATPAKSVTSNCAQLLEALFTHRFTSEHPQGIALKANKIRLCLDIRPIGPGCPAVRMNALGELPDVLSMSQPWLDLQALYNRCVDDLGAYSRSIGRQPTMASRTMALPLLPGELLPSATATLQALRQWLAETLGHRAMAMVPARELLKNIAPAEGGAPIAMDKKGVIAIAQVLHAIGYGFEPDPRFSDAKLVPDQPVVLFHYPSHAPDTASDGYCAVTLYLQLAAMVAHGNGTVGFDAVERHLSAIAEWTQLSDDERSRARAHWQALVHRDGAQPVAKRRLAVCSEQERERLATFLIALVVVDNHINPQGMKLLTQLFTLLGVPLEGLYESTPTLSAVAIRGQRPTGLGSSPTGSALALDEPSRLVLDMDAVRSKALETAQVQQLLASIFQEDEPSSLQAAPDGEGPQPTRSVGALDAEHSELFLLLATRSSWHRGELESLAIKRQLMLDGALELLNDAAFDLFGVPLFEGDDPIDINPVVREQLADEHDQTA